MSEPFRIQGPGGSSDLSGIKKDRTVGANDFKKYMIEEVKDIDPHQKRNRRRRQEEQEDAEEEAKKALAIPSSDKSSSIEQVGGPATKKAGTAPTAPLSSSAPSSTTPFAEFQAESIEEYAWQEDSASSAPTSSSPQPTTNQPSAASPPSAQTSSSVEATAYTEEAPLYTTPEAEEAPSPPYDTQGYEGQTPSYWEEQPYYAPSAPSSKTSDQTKEDYPSEEKSFPASRKKQKTPEELEQKPSKAATPPKTAKEKALAGEKTPLTEEPAIAKEARKKGKSPPMLTEVEKHLKDVPVEFKKLMEEQAATAPEEDGLPEEAGAKTTAAPKKGKKGRPSEKGTVQGPLKGPLPILEKTPSEAALAATPGVLPPDLSSTKKTTTDKLSSKKAREQEEPTEVEEEGLAIPPLTRMTPSSQGEADGERRQREPGEWGLEPAIPPAPFTPTTTPAAQPTTGVASTSPYAELHPEILDLFERLVGVITVMQTAGISETTMTLSEKAFANSSLLGASITIRTYDFAPKEMNVEFSGSPQAIAQMQQNLPSLLAAFQAGKYNFVIKRFDFKIGATERPIFRRKDELRERGNDQQQNKEDRE